MNQDKLAMMRAIKTRDDIPAFLEAVELNRAICEVGVQNAKNFLVLLRCKPFMAFAVDIWPIEGIYQNAVNRIGHLSNVKMLKMSSIDAAISFNYDSLDFVYLDANHSYKHISQDLRAWYPKVRFGGIIAGHDYRGVDSGVVRAVAEFVEDECIDFMHVTDEPCPSFMFFKETTV